jgi:hypothetical protein
MGPGLELLHRLFVDVRGTIDREFLDARGHRDRPGYTSAGALSGFYDFGSGLIDYPIVIAPKFDANALAFHGDKKNEGLGASGSLCGRLDDLGEERVRNLLEMGGRDGGAGAALR